MLCEDGRRESAAQVHIAQLWKEERSFLAPLAPDVGQDSGVKCNVDTAACLPPHFLPLTDLNPLSWDPLEYEVWRCTASIVLHIDQ